jgi:ribosomal protein S18 acetylase RimI-like enzyme
MKPDARGASWSIRIEASWYTLSRPAEGNAHEIRHIREEQMSDTITAPVALPDGVVLRHPHSPEELGACFPVIVQLRPRLKGVEAWIARVTEMATDGYRVLAAWEGGRVLAIAGYRIMENLIHDRFLYVDDLVTAESERGRGLGAALLSELSAIGAGQHCSGLVLDTAVTNESAQRFYRREGLANTAIRFMKPLERRA